MSSNSISISQQLSHIHRVRTQGRHRDHSPRFCGLASREDAPLRHAPHRFWDIATDVGRRKLRIASGAIGVAWQALRTSACRQCDATRVSVHRIGIVEAPRLECLG